MQPRVPTINFYLIIIVLLFHSCQSLANTKIYLNQEGYLQRSPKIVFTSQSADSFFVIESATNRTIFRGNMKLWRTNDAATKLTIYTGDFSALQNDGKFNIFINGIGRSYDFVISDSVYKDAYRKSAKGFYFQRCGLELTINNAGVYFHPKCHSADALFHSSTGLSGFHETIGGWHDAGDYGKYVVNAGVTVGTLLLAYELFPDHFNPDNLGIPESGNGVPDLLDEVRFELDWLLKMQASHGGVYFKISTEQFPAFIMPQRDTAIRYLYQISSTATADFAAIMAQAARIYRPFDADFSQRCLTAAENAWQYLSAHPNIVPAGGFQNPPGTDTGEYGDGRDGDERLWSAAELFITTGTEIYHSYFKSRYNAYGLISEPMSWPNVQTLALITYLSHTRAETDLSIRSQIRNSLLTYCQRLLTDRNQSGFYVLLAPGEYNWGCHSAALNKAILLIIAYQESKQIDFLHTALDQLHYILGVNAHSLSFITGVGDKAVKYPHHRPSGADNIPDPVPGLLAGGPNQYLQDPVLQANFNSATPPALCYIDNVGSYASNEIAINWNAPLVFVLGYFTNPAPATSVKTGDRFVPSGIRLFQNYPNPFDRTTTIPFLADGRKNVQLKIYDILGKVVFETTLTPASAMNNIFQWDGSDRWGRKVGSGVYFYHLQGSEKSETKKLIYLNRTEKMNDLYK